MATVSASSQISAKKDYLSPELRELGTVHMTTQGTGGSKNDGGGVMTRPQVMSDIRTKENIARIGTHPMGFGIYMFDYKPEFSAVNGLDRQFGVIADEVEAIVPEAVMVGTDGYKRVNYAKLGITSPSYAA